jgi:hypothetical protein
MKTSLVIAALLLAACSKAPTATQAEADPPLPRGGELLYQIYLDDGHSPAEAKRMVIAQAGPSARDAARAAQHAAEREGAVGAVKTAACRQDAGLSYC